MMLFVKGMKKNVFTLIELLVVVAIIAILAGILLPSLNLARERARSVNCIGSLKEISIGFQFYQQDHDSYFPPSRINDVSWVDYFVEEKVYNGYKVFACPSNRKSAVPELQSVNPGEFSHYGINYYHIATSLRYPGSRADVPAKQSQLRNISSVVMVVENSVSPTRSSYITADTPNDSETVDIGVATPQHNRTGINLSWADGHCSSERAADAMEVYSSNVLGQYGDATVSRWERQ